MKAPTKRRILMDELADASASVDSWDENMKALRELSLRADAWFRERARDDGGTP